MTEFRRVLFRSTKEEQEKLISCLKRDTRTSPNNKAKELYLFSGYLKCADCGRAVIRKPCRDYVYYVCSTFKRFGKIGGCTKHTIRHEKLEGAVLTAIQQQVNIAVNLQEMMETILFYIRGRVVPARYPNL